MMKMNIFGTFGISLACLMLVGNACATQRIMYSYVVPNTANIPTADVVTAMDEAGFLKDDELTGALIKAKVPNMVEKDSNTGLIPAAVIPTITSDKLPSDVVTLNSNNKIDDSKLSDNIVTTTTLSGYGYATSQDVQTATAGMITESNIGDKIPNTVALKTDLTGLQNESQVNTLISAAVSGKLDAADVTQAYLTGKLGSAYATPGDVTSVISDLPSKTQMDNAIAAATTSAKIQETLGNAYATPGDVTSAISDLPSKTQMDDAIAAATTSAKLQETLGNTYVTSSGLNTAVNTAISQNNTIATKDDLKDYVSTNGLSDALSDAGVAMQSDLTGVLKSGSAGESALAAAIAAVLEKAGSCSTDADTDEVTCESDLAAAIRDSVVNSGASNVSKTTSGKEE